jgi:hypothetical protein
LHPCFDAGAVERTRDFHCDAGKLAVKPGDFGCNANTFRRFGRMTCRNSFVTDLPVTRKTATEIAACGRARWKIENETFNVLKNNGYNLEHNFGHGKDTLASLLVVLNLLAFAMHNACDLMVRRWQEARRKLGARNRLFNHIWSISAYHVFPSWNALMRTIVTGVPPPKTA